MSLPIGVFSHPAPGRLRVSFGGRWRVNASDSVFNYGPFDIKLRAYVGAGTSMRSTILNVNVNTAVFELVYPGGYAKVPVGFLYVSHQFGGAGIVSARELYVTCALLEY